MPKINLLDRGSILQFFMLALVLFASSKCNASQVLSTGDGDTITITNGAQKTRVRLACIDAPETSQAPYGMESRQSLQRLLPIGTEVTVRSKATDRYGRTVGEVLRGSTNINQQPPLPGKMTPLQPDHVQLPGGLMEQSNASLQRDGQS
jgi:endonuclease YncB( thermonuclease family)